MTIKEIAQDLNRLAVNYQIGELQGIRKQIKNLERTPSQNIFGSKTINRDWAFHIGGRSELQFNIGNETINGKRCLRYGVAFSLETSQTLPDVSLLFPKIKRFNEYMRLYPEKFNNYYLWHWEQERSPISAEKSINPSIVKSGVFIFFGKYSLLTNYAADIVLGAFDELLPLYRYVEGAVDTEPLQTTNNSGFAFAPNLFRGTDTTSFTQAERQIDVNLRHNVIQEALIKRLATQFGQENIASEISSGISNKVDVVLKNGDDYWFYEVKTGGSARACIREALGQLLEYSFWPGAQKAAKLIVVGEPPLDRNAVSYIATLCHLFSLPIAYEQEIL